MRSRSFAPSLPHSGVRSTQELAVQFAILQCSLSAVTDIRAETRRSLRAPLRCLFLHRQGVAVP